MCLKKKNHYMFLLHVQFQSNIQGFTTILNKTIGKLFIFVYYICTQNFVQSSLPTDLHNDHDNLSSICIAVLSMCQATIIFTCTSMYLN